MKSPQVYAIIREVIGPWAKRVRALSVGLEECSATFVPRTISFILSGSSASQDGWDDNADRERDDVWLRNGKESDVRRWAEFLFQQLPRLVDRFTARSQPARNNA